MRDNDREYLEVPKPEPTPIWDEWIKCPMCNGRGEVLLLAAGQTPGISLKMNCMTCGHESESRLCRFADMAKENPGIVKVTPLRLVEIDGDPGTASVCELYYRPEEHDVPAFLKQEDD